MEQQGSSPCSQEAATAPYPGPGESSTHPHNIILPSSFLVLSSGLFPSVFPTEVLYVFLPYACYMLRLSHPSWFDNNVWRVVQIEKLRHCTISPVRVEGKGVLGMDV
jgi:hypothetical protein